MTGLVQTAQLVATLSTLTAILAALLVLGTYAVAQGTGARLRVLWLLALTASLGGAFVAGVAALVLNALG